MRTQHNALTLGDHTETAALAAPRFFGSARTLLGVSPVSSLTKLETLLLSSAAALQHYGLATRRWVAGRACYRRTFAAQAPSAGTCA